MAPSSQKRPRRRPRVLYIQYTNPGGYPPLHHSARIFASLDFETMFLGIEAFGTRELTIPHAQVRKLPSRFGQPLQKIHYLLFAVWTLGWILRWRPHVVYASDMRSAPAALLAQSILRKRIVYHEHDSPSEETLSAQRAKMTMRLVLRCRRTLLRTAYIVVFPSRSRAIRAMGKVVRTDPPITVWNCPSVTEVRSRAKRRSSKPLRLWYHGSLAPELVPPALLEALALVGETIFLDVVGYETVGNVGFADAYLAQAKRLGLEQQVSLRSAMSREHLLDACSESDVGISLIHTTRNDLNLDHMAGASNKTFDYMACGLALLVSNTHEWAEMFVEPGFGLGVDPGSPQAIADCLRWLDQNRPQVLEMGERAQRQIIQHWNYERGFEPVVRRLDASLRTSP